MTRDLTVRALEEEQMDAAELSPAVYAKVLAGLGRVNVATFSSRPTLAFLERAGAVAPFRLLDVGFGDGGMLRAIWRWASKRGVACDLVGIDLNPKSAAVALARHPEGASIAYRTGDYRSLGCESWDFILSSLTTHHMSDSQRIMFLTFMEAHARRGWFNHDLHRLPFAYYGFPILARLLGVHRIVREDGQLSVARSFRADEWRVMLDNAGIGEEGRIFRAFPFKLCVEHIR
jgi:SAM-dependent methyltransferase